MNQDHVTTSDLAFAAYLMLHDFTYITTVDNGQTDDRGNPRYDFYFTHSDPSVRENIYVHMNKLRDQFSSSDSSYADYFRHTRKLRGGTRNPVRRAEWEQQ